MKTEKKIFLDKADDLNKAVDSLISSSAEKIILNIPKGSVLGLSVHNFQVLERESETAGKELAIESVDEHILELASIATIPAVNPVFRAREKAVADILPRESAEERKPVKKTKSKAKIEKVPQEPKEGKPKRGRGGKKKTEEPPVPPEMMEDIVPKHEHHELKIEELEKIVEYVPDPGEIKKMGRERSKHSRKSWIITSSVLAVVIGFGYFAVTDILPRVTMNISIEKTSVPFSNPVIVSTGIDTASVVGNVINLPGQLSVAKGNLNMNFPATGKSTISTKAGGMLTVYNSYAVQAQVLVATTRFESPDGKIFRLVNKTTIPGMKTVNGKTTPGSVDVQVIADQPGPDYNVAPSQGWKIPGFKGKPQYDKFSVELKTSMTGGAVGNQVIPTPDDIKQGKIKIESALSDVLKSKTLILNSQNLKLLDNASVLSLTTENIGSQVDKDNNFSIFAAGELRQLVFDEKMLQDTILTSLSTSTTDMKIDNFSISYGTSTVDFVNGKMTFSISGTLTYEPEIDFDAFKNNILGLSADDLKTTIFNLPGLNKANISFWPFWVNSVPTRASHVNMTVE
jgi:hypothetical protein